MIREYENQDIDRIMQIWLSVNTRAHYFIPESHWYDHCDDVENIYIPQAQTFVYIEHEVIQGFVSVLEGAFIGGLFVDNDHQSHGIGTQLIGHCKQLFSHLELTVYTENERATAFYERCGFAIQIEQPSELPEHTEYVMTWSKEQPLKGL